ncbi:unnamed protein product [Bathycoccus prasinos]
MNTKEDMKEQPSSMMSLLSWLSEVTNQRSSIASVKELKSCSVLLVLCENLLSKERDLRKRTKKTNDDDDDYDYDDNNNNKSPSDSVLLHVALDELNVGGEYVKAVLEEDEFGILEVIQKLKEKYDLREEVEKLSKDFLHGYDDEKKGEEDAKDENNEDDDDDDDVFGTRDGDALDELDDLGFDHIVAPNARGSSYTSLPPAPPNVSSPVKFINAYSLLGGERTFETSPPFKNSNANNIITRRNDDEEDREEVGNDLFQRRSPIQRAPSFMRWNQSTEEEKEEEEEEENEENQVTSVSKVRRNPEPLAWFSPLNPDEAAVSKAETKLSVAEIALLRRGKASLSSSFASVEKKKVDKISSPYFTTKSAEGSRRASSPSVSPSFSKASANVGKRTNASEIKIALKFGALAGESDQMKRLRNEALQALETENAPGAKHQFIILFSETSENSKTYRGLYKVSKSESTSGDGTNVDGVTLRKIHGTSEKVPDALRSSRILKTLKFNLASKMWHALHDEVDANAMAVVLKPPKKKK